jgi:hypothetical protein
MRPAIEDLLVKIEAIAQGPNAELFWKLVDLLYEQSGRQEEYDDEPFTPEDLRAIKNGEEAFKRGEFVVLGIMKKNETCELLRTGIPSC